MAGFRVSGDQLKIAGVWLKGGEGGKLFEGQKKNRQPEAAGSDADWKSGLDSGDAGCLRAFGALFDFKADLLAFSQGTEAITDDSGEMDKNVLAAVFRSDKAKTLGFVKPLNGTVSHGKYLNLSI